MSRADVLIEAIGVEKFYPAPDGNRIEVIAPLDLALYPGEILAVLGPSGCGKSTLLRILSGLSRPSAGKVIWNGGEEGPGSVGIVFQSFALFPWLTVEQNVEAPLEARAVPREERAKRSLHALDIVGLDGFENAYPKELSGGMKQRVGFARALVVEPEVLFMDEPFSALDVLTAENLRKQVVDLWRSRKLPTKSIFIVTHNIEEAVLLADRIIVLGRNPARVRTDFTVMLPEQRDRKSPEFVAYVDYIYKVLTEPSLDASHLPSAPEAAGAATVVRRKYQMLPHARPGGVTGLLEILIDHGGRADIYRLADDLVMDVDDLLPIIEGGRVLGFLETSEGDVEVTPTGRQFAEAGILRQKEIFREAALTHVTLLQQIRRTLESKADHRVSREFFHDLLDEHFSEEEVERQLDTAVNWGRFAELFDYDSDAQKFVLPEPEPAPMAGTAK